MDLLEKFAAVEVKADNRISEKDKFYCEQHQAAYKAAVSMFKELIFVWADMQKQQDELLEISRALFITIIWLRGMVSLFRRTQSKNTLRRSTVTSSERLSTTSMQPTM